MPRLRLTALLLLISATALEAKPAPPSTAGLEQAIRHFLPEAPGHLGVAAIDLESGRRVAVDGDGRYPMASTAKVAIVATFLHQLEQGLHRLDEMITVNDRARSRSEGITETLPHPGVALSAINLIELTLTVSDNTAADTLLATVGGPEAVTAWLRNSGIHDQRVDRTIARLILDVGNKPPVPGLTDAEALARHSPVEPWKADEEAWPPNPAFDADPRDTTTPLAMADFLARLRQGRLLNAADTALLFEVMGRCKTGRNRVGGLLPPGTPWAHKTGTLPGIADDVGVLTLPNGHHLVVAIFAYGIVDPVKRSRALADIGRLLYDGFSME